VIPADHCARLPFPARTFRLLESAAWDVLLCASSSVRGCCGTAGPAAAGARTPAGGCGGVIGRRRRPHRRPRPRSPRSAGAAAAVIVRPLPPPKPPKPLPPPLPPPRQRRRRPAPKQSGGGGDGGVGVGGSR